MASSGRIRALRDMADFLEQKNGVAVDIPLHGKGSGSTAADEKAMTRAYEIMLREVLRIKVGPPGDSESWTETYTCMRDLTVALTLLAYGRRTAAMHVVTMCIERARRMHLTWAEHRCLTLLRSHAALGGRTGEVSRLSTQITNITIVLDAEDQCDHLEQTVTASLARTASSRQAEARTTHELADQADALRHEYQRFTMHLAYFRIRSRAYQQENNLRSAIEICKEALKWYDRHVVFRTPTRVGEFVLKQFVCLMYLRDKVGATRLANETRSLLESNPAIWPTVVEYLYTLSVYHLDLEEAAKACAEMRKRAARGIAQHQRDLWKFHEVLIHVLSDAGVPGAVGLGPSRFYFANVRRQLASLSRDTRGVNISLYVFDVLHLLVRHRYSDAEQSIELFGVFARRQLKDSATRRSRLFARLLGRIPGQDFSAEALRNAGKELLGQISALSDQIDDGEYVPYERLWELILQVLERNADGHKRRR